MALPKTSKLALVTLAALVLAACGGGDSGTVSSSSGYTVESGVAQKGPLAQGSAIWVNELAATTYKPNGKEYTFRTTNDFGTFAPSGITYGTPYLSTLAQGYYYNEITGTQSDDVVLLSGLSQIGAEGSTAADTAINLNVLSSMAVNRITKLATTAPTRTFTAARAKAQKETLGAFYIYNDASILSGTKVGGVAQPANLTALDLSKSRAADQILAAISAVVMKAGVNGAGVNALLSQTASDLEDDGLLNNSTNYRTSVQSKLCAAAAVTDFSTVASNLNSLYGTNYSATDLSQWVDTSGCVDQVINKYKFTANNVAVGAISKSPAYTIGADDVGQCFSVGGVTTGATAGLYYNGAATSVVGTQLVKAGDSLAIGVSADSAVTYSGFIQRSAPAANGTCPTAVPLSGLTRVEKYTIITYATPYVVSTFAGPRFSPYTDAGFSYPTSVAFDANSNLYVGQTGSPEIIKISPNSVVSTIGGCCVVTPAIAVDANGNVYAAETANNKIRKITAAGVVSTLAGTGAQGSADGAGVSATFYRPGSIAVDSNGSVYVADYNNTKIRKITAAGVVSTLAGTGAQGSADGAGAAATFSSLVGVAVDANGNVYVADANKIRKITAAGVVSTLAGTGAQGSADGAGAVATFNYPIGIAVDSNGTVYVADHDNRKIRKITPSGSVSTIAGTGQDGSTNGSGAEATFRMPKAVAVDAKGSVYVADYLANTIRKLTPQ